MGLVVFLAVDTAFFSKMTPIGVPPRSHIFPTEVVVFLLRHIFHPFRRGGVVMFVNSLHFAYLGRSLYN